MAAEPMGKARHRVTGASSCRPEGSVSQSLVLHQRKSPKHWGEPSWAGGHFLQRQVPHRATSPALGGTSHQPCPKRIPLALLSPSPAHGSTEVPQTPTGHIPHPEPLLFPRRVKDALKRIKNSAGPGGAGLREGSSCGCPRAGPQWRGGQGGRRSSVSHYRAVSILSRPPGSAAARARPGSEPAQINSRASKGNGDVAGSPVGRPAERHHKTGVLSRGRGSGGHPNAVLLGRYLGGERGLCWVPRSPSDPRRGLHPRSPWVLPSAQPLHPPRLWSGDLHSLPPPLWPRIVLG